MTNMGLISDSTGNNYNKVDRFGFIDQVTLEPSQISIRCREVILRVQLGRSW